MQEAISIPDICQSFVFGEQDHCQKSGGVELCHCTQGGTKPGSLAVKLGPELLGNATSYSQVFTFIFAAVPVYELVLTWLCWLVCANTACTDEIFHVHPVVQLRYTPRCHLCTGICPACTESATCIPWRNR